MLCTVKIRNVNLSLYSNTRWSNSIIKSWSIFGIKFAPLLIPLERRLQTLSVLLWISSYLTTGLLSSTAMYLLMSTSFWWITPMYLTWIVYDLQTCNNGGRKGFLVNWMKNSKIWKLYANFFPITLVKTTELDSEKVTGI